MEATQAGIGRAIPTGVALVITVGIGYAACTLGAVFGWIAGRLRPSA